jgi:hypothetical protein
MFQGIGTMNVVNSGIKLQLNYVLFWDATWKKTDFLHWFVGEKS